jgi:hypothetical protein
MRKFISKAVTFEGLIHVMKGMVQYWSEIVELPQKGRAGK